MIFKSSILAFESVVWEFQFYINESETNFNLMLRKHRSSSDFFRLAGIVSCFDNYLGFWVYEERFAKLALIGFPQ